MTITGKKSNGVTVTKKPRVNKATVKQASPIDLQQQVDDLKLQIANQKPIPPTESPPVDIVQSVNANPLMAKARIPGQTYQIPSQGLLYTDGELDPSVENGEVHVYPMTTIDEIVIRTPDLLFSGAAVEQVFQRCIPSILKPRLLFAKDVDFLMVALRQVSYGEIFDVNHTHDCEDAQQLEYKVNMTPFIQNTKQIDPTSITRMFNIVLDNGQKVSIRPIRYDNVIRIMQVFDDDITPEEHQKRLLDTLVGIIDSVDGITADEHIAEWLRAIPIKWAKDISAAIDRTGDWGPTFTTEVECGDCGEMTKLTIPMNPISFFT